MRNAKHTRGPWTAPTTPYRDIRGDGPNFSGGDWEILPPLGEAGPVAIVATEADARLIAAAPALVVELDALTDFVERLVDDGFMGPHSRVESSAVDRTRSARAMIREATGADHA